MKFSTLLMRDKPKIIRGFFFFLVSILLSLWSHESMDHFSTWKQNMAGGHLILN